MLRRFAQRFWTAFVAVFFLAVFVLGVCASGCKSSEKAFGKIGLQYAVGSYLESVAPDKRVSEAREILGAVVVLNDLVGHDTTTVDELKSYLQTRLANLPPSKRLALGNLVNLGGDVLKERVGEGVVKGDAVLVVKDVLSWVEEAANAYVPSTPAS